MAKPGKQTSLSSKKNVCPKISISERDLKNRHNTFALCHKKTMPPGIEETKMTKNALYSIGSRVSGDIISQIRKDMEEHSIKTQSEWIKKAILYRLNTREEDKNTLTNNIIITLDDPKVEEKVSQMIDKRIKNLLLSIAKNK